MTPDDLQRLAEKLDRITYRVLYWSLLIGTAVGAVGVLRLLKVVP